MDKAIVDMIKSAQRRKSLTSKLDVIYPMFHSFTVTKGFELCSAFEKATDLSVPETLWQLLMEKVFLKHLSKEMCPIDSEPLASSSSNPDRSLSMIESNAVRYTAGFVIRKVEQKISKKKDKSVNDVQCVAALNEMAGKLKEQNPLSDIHPSSKWIKLVDRGGLYHVQDIVYDLFVTIEYFVNAKLTDILKQRGRGIECVQKDHLTWVVDQEEVQSLWNEVSPSSIVEDETARRYLLLELVHLWITTRGHSKTHKLKEKYKAKQKKNVKRTRSLRKQLHVASEPTTS